MSTVFIDYLRQFHKQQIQAQNCNSKVTTNSKTNVASPDPMNSQEQQLWDITQAVGLSAQEPKKKKIKLETKSNSSDQEPNMKKKKIDVPYLYTSVFPRKRLYPVMMIKRL